MGVRKSMEEEISVSGSKEEWMGKCFRALDAGGFSNVEQNQTIYFSILSIEFIF